MSAEICQHVASPAPNVDDQDLRFGIVWKQRREGGAIAALPVHVLRHHGVADELQFLWVRFEPLHGAQLGLGGVLEQAVVGFEGVLKVDALEEIGKLRDPGIV